MYLFRYSLEMLTVFMSNIGCKWRGGGEIGK